MITLARLSDRPDALPALAAGYRSEWPGWYGAQGPGDAEHDLAARAGPGPLPFAIVAFLDVAPVGTAAVTAGSIASFAHLTPWLTGLWVAPHARGRGVASALIEAAADEARARGMGRLHAATEHGRALFERLGWRRLETTEEDGQILAVLAVDLA